MKRIDETMKPEVRTIRAMMLAGWTDILIGLIMYFTGWGDWYYAHFHIFGIFGMTAITYGLWHQYYYEKETGGKVWQKIKESLK